MLELRTSRQTQKNQLNDDGGLIKKNCSCVLWMRGSKVEINLLPPNLLKWDQCVTMDSQWQAFVSTHWTTCKGSKKNRVHGGHN